MPLLRRYLKLDPDEGLDPILTCQSQAHQVAFTFQINVKIEEGAALCFGRHPTRQLSDRNIRRAVLKFVAAWHLDDLLPDRDQFFSQLLVLGTFRWIQGFHVAVELAGAARLSRGGRCS